jgi:GNAT superfamily N-acetyltransferase
MLRDADPADIERLATIWHDGWHDAHAGIMPELIPMRSLMSFRDRLPGLLPDTRVVDIEGRVAGLCVLKNDELYQIYVAVEARGTGAAKALIADAEQRLKRQGVKLAWLACAIGNDRAARFYEKSGWSRAGVISYQSETASGPFRADVWRYEKPL